MYLAPVTAVKYFTNVSLRSVIDLAGRDFQIPKWIKSISDSVVGGNRGLVVTFL